MRAKGEGAVVLCKICNRRHARRAPCIGTRYASYRGGPIQSERSVGEPDYLRAREKEREA